MAKKTKQTGKPIAFRDAIKLALQAPRLTHKQIDELRKQGKLHEMMKT